MKSNTISVVMLLGIFMLCSCSMTKNIPADDQLFTGLKPIEYVDERKDSFPEHLATTKEELEAALATEPNGSLFGSSYYSVPWSWHLWVYNHYSAKKNRFARWMTKTFGKPPVLMSNVNPALRASVARSVLRNNGYFRGSVSYSTITGRNPRKAKIAYSVRLDSLFTLDSVAYTGFPRDIRHLLDSTADERLIAPGAPFSVTALDGERSRIGTLLRNSGYYYYSSGYATYLADTFATADKVDLRLQLASELPEASLKKWYIGNVDIEFRKSFREVLDSTLRRRFMTIHFNGKSSPIRPGVVARNLRLRPHQAYSYAKYTESVSKINATGVFSSVDFQFTPRKQQSGISTTDSLLSDTVKVPTGTVLPADTMDLRLSCTFEKPYDFYFEASAIGRTSGRYGPEARVGITRRNAFRGAEKLDVNLHGAYEWQTSQGSDMNSYQYGVDASIEFPRIIAPFYDSDRVRRDREGRRRPRRYFAPPTTYAKLSSDIIRRPGYYKMHIVSGEWTYRWQTSQRSRHEFSPLTLKYQFMNSHTAKFDSIMTNNLYLNATMEDYFVPKMRYTYIYTKERHPLRWEITVEESGNITSLWDVAGGHSFNEKGKTLFKNPYAQFIRVETDITKTWGFGGGRSLVAHLNAGVLRSFGNSDINDAPFSELFYAGGANSIRAFSVRSIGPGSFVGLPGSKQFNYLMQNGDLKFVANLEYRTRLFGDLHGAVFIDAGNVWRWKDMKVGDSDIDFDGADFTDLEKSMLLDYMNNWMSGTQLRLSTLGRQIALGTGIGLRYDLGFLVVRADWGLALHAPYDTGSSGYFNINRFRDAHTLHIAIGYPF